MNTKTVRSDGKVISDTGTATIDHHVDVFTVAVRSTDGVSAEMLREVIQKHLEVVHILQDTKHKVVK